MEHGMLSGRQRDILALIETDGAQYIEDLAARYHLTTQTIRRDINALCDLGFARRFHGGVSVPVEGHNISINARAALNRTAKQCIAKLKVVVQVAAKGSATHEKAESMLRLMEP